MFYSIRWSSESPKAEASPAKPSATSAISTCRTPSSSAAAAAASSSSSSTSTTTPVTTTTATSSVASKPGPTSSSVCTATRRSRIFPQCGPCRRNGKQWARDRLLPLLYRSIPRRYQHPELGLLVVRHHYISGGIVIWSLGRRRDSGCGFGPALATAFGLLSSRRTGLMEKLPDSDCHVSPWCHFIAHNVRFHACIVEHASTCNH